jgi:uncharacterized membrane protein (UPF0136 family)
MQPIHQMQLPYKSVAGALMLGLFFGPLGLLYATTGGGIVMLIVAVAIVPTKLPVPIVLVWLGSCIWSVIAANRYNRNLLQKIYHNN